MAEQYAHIADRFKCETADHEMTVLHDDGLYRHLRFSVAERGFYWFDLITVPGVLVFRGDGESFVFSRQEDMFDFFRRSRSGGSINPGYWAEKLTSNRDASRAYSEDLFRQKVAEQVAAHEDQFPGLAAAVEREFFDTFSEWPVYDHDGALEALRSFEHLPDGADEPFTFDGFWEWNLHDFGWWFLWACHAIVWGIGRYDAVRAGVSASQEEGRTDG